MRKLTLDEKIGQMTQPDVHALAGTLISRSIFLGSILNGGGGGPTVNFMENWLKVINEYESWSLKTRLKIPLLYGVDAVHGHTNVDGAVIFPYNIGLGAGTQSRIAEQAERITALEAAGTGTRWAFAPCIAVAQDERWGRTYESFGDSPRLVSTRACFCVRGFRRSTTVGFRGACLCQTLCG